MKYYTESHSTVRVGRDLCGSSSPTPLAKQVHLEQAAWDLVRSSLAGSAVVKIMLKCPLAAVKYPRTVTYL